jgi:hypothetical protein
LFGGKRVKNKTEIIRRQRTAKTSQQPNNHCTPDDDAKCPSNEEEPKKVNK